LRVGLSGGVGSGKSTVSARLRSHGAVVIDADAIAREVVEPGTPGFAAVVDRFGDNVVREGRLDRAALADLVFDDEQARQDLNGIVHPLVRDRTAELMSRTPHDAIVIYDVPLLVESELGGDFDVVVMVLADADVRLQRLLGRGMREHDARARMAAQASDVQRRAAADEVIENNGTRAELDAAADSLWDRLRTRQQ
jgi:dephospho-CoA kinase